MKTSFILLFAALTSNSYAQSSPGSYIVPAPEHLESVSEFKFKEHQFDWKKKDNHVTVHYTLPTELVGPPGKEIFLEGEANASTYMLIGKKAEAICEEKKEKTFCFVEHIPLDINFQKLRKHLKEKGISEPKRFLHEELSQLFKSDPVGIVEINTFYSRD